MSPKMVLCAQNDGVFYRNMGAVNSNMTSDFKLEVVIWLKLHMRIEKLLFGERRHRTVELFTSYRKSMSLNPFPVTEL